MEFLPSGELLIDLLGLGIGLFPGNSDKSLYLIFHSVDPLIDRIQNLGGSALALPKHFCKLGGTEFIQFH